MDAVVKRHIIGLVAAVLVLNACGGARRSGEVVVTERASPNYTVFVIEDVDGIRRLRFERHGIDQSAVVLGDPEQLIFAYMRGLVTALAIAPQPERVLIIGLGGGSFPMFLRRHLPTTHIDVVEIDPIVVEVAKHDLGFVEDPALVVHVADGAAFVEGSSAKWDIIVLDAYGADEIPQHLATRAFYQEVLEHLAPGGLVAANVWSDHANPRYRSMLRTFEAVFPEVHVVAPPRSESRIVLATGMAQHLTREDIAASAAHLKKAWSLRFDLPAMIRRGHKGPGELPPDGEVIEE
jgi:spermidine synthase